MKILKTIKRANKLEMSFILLLIVAQICNTLGYFGPIILDIRENTARIIWNVGDTFEIGLACILCTIMHAVNKQLALFFH